MVLTLKNVGLELDSYYVNHLLLINNFIVSVLTQRFVQLGVVESDNYAQPYEVCTMTRMQSSISHYIHKLIIRPPNSPCLVGGQ
jgi:hypothetical protein